jgi:polysaccharide biosynthesis/export protein
MTRPGAALMALLVGPAPALAAGAEYRVGPGDVLEVTVTGDAGSSRLVTVQTTGAIFLAAIGELPVGGLTVEEIEFKLVEEWSRSDLAVPEVRVRVSEYRSRSVWVTGEVVRPGRTPLKGATRLLDVLLAAGGLTGAASGEVVVERREGTFADGSTVMHVILSGSGPTPEELRGLETLVTARDVITAEKGRYVQVSGAVARPGRYALRRGTLAEALRAAGGTTKVAGLLVKVSRIDPQTGAARVLELEPGRDRDARVFSEDQVVVLTRVQ